MFLMLVSARAKSLRLLAELRAAETDTADFAASILGRKERRHLRFASCVIF
jgi:hypothetical protein